MSAMQPTACFELAQRCADRLCCNFTIRLMLTTDFRDALHRGIVRKIGKRCIATNNIDHRSAFDPRHRHQDSLSRRGATVGLMSEGNYWVTMVGERTELECRVRARSHTLPGGKRKWRIDISLKQWFPDFFWSRTICGYRAFTTYHLVPENSSYQVSIRSKVLKTGIDTNATWITMTVRNYNCHFQKPR